MRTPEHVVEAAAAAARVFEGAHVSPALIAPEEAIASGIERLGGAVAAEQEAP